MALAVNNTTPNSTQSANPTYNHTISGSDTMLVVGLSIFDSDLGNRTVSGITFNGDSLTKLRADEIEDTEGQRTEIWYLINPDAGEHEVNITMGGGSPFVDSFASTVTGAHQSSQPDSEAGNTDLGVTSLSTNITTVTDNALIIDVFETQTGNATPDASQTEIMDESGGTSNASYKIVGAAGVHAMEWTFSSDDVVTSVIGIKAAGGGVTAHRLSLLGVGS